MNTLASTAATGLVRSNILNALPHKGKKKKCCKKYKRGNACKKCPLFK